MERMGLLKTGFNTQPPEGGWLERYPHAFSGGRFNTQPPEGGWVVCTAVSVSESGVSTHSRLKAAGAQCGWMVGCCRPVSTHSRLKAAGHYES